MFIYKPKNEEEQMDTLQGTVFDETINLYQHIKNDMIRNLATYISTDVKARSRPYRKDRYTARPNRLTALFLVYLYSRVTKQLLVSYSRGYEELGDSDIIRDVREKIYSIVSL